MSVRAQVAAVVSRYDDDAWIALANRGLLRRARKDLESVPVEVVAETPTEVEVAVGDVVVSLGTGGPGEARCTCPSAVVCQHVLAAGLWLAAGAEPSAEPAVSGPRADDLHEDLMALDAATLTAYAGLPGYRWACTLLDDTDEPPAVARDGYLTITFTRPDLTVRYLGGGLDGLVLDQSVPSVERYRVAAVLAWQRAHGKVLPPPPPAKTRASGPTEPSLSRAESRERLRRTVAAVLRDTVRVGVSHLSPAIHERLVTSAVWSQGVEYHRLALLLRRVADEAELLMVRSARADDLVLLDDVAVAHALVAALDASAGHEPPALLGRARASYDPVRRLDLVGLGGRPWRTSSGYHGLTCVFWDPERSRAVTWTDARPDELAGFDPRARWQQPAPWTGLRTPAEATGRRIALTQAHLSPDNRLSGVESTSAAVADLSGAELTAMLPVRRVWADLAAPRATGLLDVDDPASAWSVLRPAGALAVRWDPVSQTLTWPVLDEDGEVLVLEVPWSRLHAHVIGRLEALGGSLPAGACVVARIRRVRGRLVGEPLSLVLPDRAARAVDALHFDVDPDAARGTRSSLVTRLLAEGTPDRPTSVEEEPGPRAVPAALAAVRAVVEQTAQRGCAGTVPGEVHGRLAAAHAAARAVGLSVFVEPDPGLDAAEVLLQSSYLVQQVERALG